MKTARPLHVAILLIAAWSDASAQRARSNCAWRARMLTDPGGPDVAPAVVPQFLGKYFPGETRSRERDAVVVLIAGIDSTGRITKTMPYLSLPGLDEKAEKELRKAVIRPAERAGTPIESWVFIPVRFVH